MSEQMLIWVEVIFNISYLSVVWGMVAWMASHKER